MSLKQITAAILAGCLAIRVSAVQINHGPVVAVAAGSDLINENFESGSTPSGWTNDGSFNVNYTTTVLQGSKSIAATIDGQDLISPAFAANGTVELYFMFRTDTVGPASLYVIAGIRGAAGVGLVEVAVASSGQLIIADGFIGGNSTTNTSTSTALPANTLVHIWVRQVKGTGSNQVITAGWSTNGVRPTSGAQFASLSNGARTNDAVDIFFCHYAFATWAGIWDRAIVRTATIGDNP